MEKKPSNKVEAGAMATKNIVVYIKSLNIIPMLLLFLLVFLLK